MKISTLSAILITACSFPLSASAAVVEYSEGHGDIGLAFHDGELELHYHFADGAVLDGAPLASGVEVEFEPNEAYVRVGDNTSSTAIANIPFLGLTAGDPFWVLPSTNQSGRPFLGIAAEELSASEFSNATISLTDFRGPGEFALYNFDGNGVAQVTWQTNDGVDSSDLLNLAIGGHDHFNYAFTAPGVYLLELTATVNQIGVGPISDIETFQFVVGSNTTAVPEPGSLLALGVIAIGGVVVQRRRKKNASTLV